MTRFMCVLAAVAFAVGTADAASLTHGLYSLVGRVASSNGNPNCAHLGLSLNSAINTVIAYPQAGKGGFQLYVPTPGAEQYCTSFLKQPTAGLNGYKTTATCNIYTLAGDQVPAPGVSFAFTARTIDSNTAIGTVKVAIPLNAVGGGCVAVIDVTYVRSGV